MKWRGGGTERLEHWGGRDRRQKSKGGGPAPKSAREQSNVDELRMLRAPHVGRATRRPKVAQ